MKLERTFTLAALALAAFAIHAGAQPAPRQPIGQVPNGSAEALGRGGRGGAALPENWTIENGRQGGPAAAVAMDAAHSGSHSLMMPAGGGNWQTKALVKPFAQYKLSAWVKTDGVGTSATTGATQNAGAQAGAVIGARGLAFNVRSTPASGTSDWKQIDVAFETGDEDSIYITASIAGPAGARGARGARGAGRGRRGAGGAPVQGTAWFDDVKLDLVSAKDLKPAININLAKLGDPMPDLIYGQFIEHLGRSIYGGIWAEMLEDRKFWYPVTRDANEGGGRGFGGRGARGGRGGRGAGAFAVNPAAQILFRPITASPWLAIGGVDAVTMLTTESQHVYVGAETPQIDLGAGGTPRGIEQGGLGVIAGKGYAGRVILAGEASAAPIEVSLVWGSSPSQRQTVKIAAITADYKKYPVQFKSGATTDTARLEIVGAGRGKFMIGTASLMPDDNIGGMRKDTIAALKQLNAPIYRWPGGNFVSGYDWHDGLGDVDKRPPRKNPAWTGVESNDFGMHEYFAFLKEVGAQPFIALNAGLGSADSAADEVEYVNGSASTPMGMLRAKNGHPAPFHGTYWAVGNEMSGSWQLGTVGIEQFTQRNNDFAKRVRAIDPGVKLIASGEATNMNVNNWDTQLLTQSGDFMDLISKHFYMQDYSSPGGLLSHGRQIGDSIHRVAESFREYEKTVPAIAKNHLKVSLDEWNFWYGPHVFGELGTRYFLRDALGIAGGLNEYSRDGDVIGLATYAQTVNVIGAIKTNKTNAVLDSTGEALAMYRAHFGYIPVGVTGAPEPLDVAATLSKDRKHLTISVVNMTYDKQTLALKLAGGAIAASGKSWVLTGPDDMAYNDPAAGIKVKYDEHDVNGVKDSLEVAPCSATIFDFAVK